MLLGVEQGDLSQLGFLSLEATYNLLMVARYSGTLMYNCLKNEIMIVVFV